MILITFNMKEVNDILAQLNDKETSISCGIKMLQKGTFI